MLVSQENGTSVSGNYCSRGVAFATTHSDQFRAPFRQIGQTIELDHANMVLAHWNLHADSIKGSAAIIGSPERSLRRTVVQCGHDRYILEEISESQAGFREMIARVIAELPMTIPAVSYLRGNDSKAVVQIDNSFWMVQPFLEHTPLDRDTFWKDPIRGIVVGELLSNLRTVVTTQSLPVYSSKKYLEKLISSIGKTRIAVRKQLTPILAYLDRTILPEIESLPTGFSHGDCHPLNMLWYESSLIALIDWEFCGIRPRIYDTALVIGCVGTESPESIDSPFVRAILECNSAGFSAREKSLLAPMVVLNRFNWLSEWLRRHDEEMILFELEYMKFLVDRFERDPLL